MMMLQFMGCGSESPGGEQDGVEVIRNGEETVSKKIDFGQVANSTADSFEEAIGSPRDIAADSEANIFLLDSKKTQIIRYNPELKYINSIGRIGQGPGELYYPMSMSFDSQNRLYVTDVMQRINIFETQGGYISTLKLDEIAYFLYAGGKAGQISIGYRKLINKESGNDEGDKDIYFSLADFGVKENSVSDFYSKEQFVAARIQKGDKFLLVLPTYVLMTGIQDDLYVCAADKYEILVYDASRKLKRKIIKDYNPIPVSAKDLKIALDMMNTPEKKKGLRKIARFHPVMKSIALDEEGKLWVEMFKPFEIYKNSYEADYDVFSKEGKYLFSTTIPEKVVRKLLFANGFLYCVVENPDGEYLIKKFKMN